MASAWYLEPFVLNAGLAGLLLTAILAPLGCVVVWRRMAYFGDALAHAAMLGYAASLWLHIAPMAGAILAAFGFALLSYRLNRKNTLSIDSILGVLSYGGLASGVALISLLPPGKASLAHMLLGDLLTINMHDILLLAVGLLVLCALGWRYWQAVLLWCVSPALAVAEGLRIHRLHLGFLMLLALCAGLALPLVGALMVGAMLIIPPSTARLLARTPLQMLLISLVCGVLSVLAGLSIAWHLDLPAGPAMVLSQLVLLAAAWAVRGKH